MSSRILRFRSISCPSRQSARFWLFIRPQRLSSSGSDRGAEPALELAHGVHGAAEAPCLVQFSSACPSCICQQMKRALLRVASVARVVHGQSCCSELAQSDYPEHTFTHAIRSLVSVGPSSMLTPCGLPFALRLSVRTRCVALPPAIACNHRTPCSSVVPCDVSA